MSNITGIVKLQFVTIRDFADNKEELVEAAVQHAVAVHGHKDTPELRQEIEKQIEVA